MTTMGIESRDPDLDPPSLQTVAVVLAAVCGYLLGLWH